MLTNSHTDKLRSICGLVLWLRLAACEWRRQKKPQHDRHNRRHCLHDACDVQRAGRVVGAGARYACAAQRDGREGLWLDCYSQSAIAGIIGEEYPAFEGTDQTTISEWLGKIRKSGNSLEPPDSRQHFDIWQFANGPGLDFFGGLGLRRAEHRLHQRGPQPLRRGIDLDERSEMR